MSLLDTLMKKVMYQITITDESRKCCQGDTTVLQLEFEKLKAAWNEVVTQVSNNDIPQVFQTLMTELVEGYDQFIRLHSSVTE
jgi:hypothetical protein